MCTAVTLQSLQSETFLGRTMDFSHNIAPGLYVLCKNHIWNNILNGKQMSDYYSFIGIGQESNGLLGFFDGMNERGFGAAALYFAGYAKYDAPIGVPGKEPVSSLDFLHFILGQCSSVGDLERQLPHVSIVGYPDPVTGTVAPLHWIAADITGQCAVVEQTESGLALFRNPVGVMANSPDFPWHMTNLRNYMGASPEQIPEALWGNVRLAPFGQGAGSSLLPGGYTSPERFVRTAFQKSHVPTPKNREEAVLTCFHIMEGVTIPKGVVVTDRNTYDYTQYTAFMNLNTGEYFFKTYENPQVFTASLPEYSQGNARSAFIGSLDHPAHFASAL